MFHSGPKNPGKILIFIKDLSRNSVFIRTEVKPYPYLELLESGLSLLKFTTDVLELLRHLDGLGLLGLVLRSQFETANNNKQRYCEANVWQRITINKGTTGLCRVEC